MLYEVFVWWLFFQSGKLTMLAVGHDQLFIFPQNEAENIEMPLTLSLPCFSVQIELEISKNMNSVQQQPGVNSIKKYKVYFTSRTVIFTNSHQFESTKSLYKFPLEASNLYSQW